MKKLDGFMHGINLGGWLSQCDNTKERYDTFITENDIKTIKEWGLDHVRVPVDYMLVETEEGEYKEDGFAYIQTAIDWCKKYGLNMILDLHKTCGYSFDAAKNCFFETPALHERFYKLWEQFATRFAKNEDMLCFELLNEVTSQEYGKLWNSMSKTCISRIRAIAPTIRILVGSYWNNSVTSVKDLDPPYDENIIYNFHCYEPLLFTHQGAGWVGPNMNPDFRWPLKATFAEYSEMTIAKCGQACANFSQFDANATPDENYFETLFAEALKVASDRNVELYCGEYGVIDRTDPAEALKWYKILCSVLDKHGIGRAAWSYKEMDFGLSDSRMDAVRPELLKVL